MHKLVYCKVIETSLNTRVGTARIRGGGTTEESYQKQKTLFKIFSLLLSLNFPPLPLRLHSLCCSSLKCCHFSLSMYLWEYGSHTMSASTPEFKSPHSRRKVQKELDQLCLNWILERLNLVGSALVLCLPLVWLIMSKSVRTFPIRVQQPRLVGFCLFHKIIYWGIVDLQYCVNSAVWHRDSVIYTFVYCFSDSSPIYVITEYWVEFPVLYSSSLLVIYFIYSSVYMLIPTS